MEPTALFKGWLILGKLIILVSLLILSFINGHKKYVEENPRKFMWDSFAAGGFGALALVIIGMMRGVTDNAQLAEIGFTTFLLLFTFNVFCEFSGFNTGGADAETTQGEKKILKAKWPLGALFIGGLLVLFALSWNVQQSGFKTKNDGIIGEALIFGVLSGAAQTVNSKNHGESKFKTASMTFAATVFFIILYVALQYGGLMDAIYSARPPCMNF